jgi:hypothetical protein
MNKKSIEDAFKRLNDINGYRMFELFCQKLISQHIDKNFLPSTGSDAGGDGGIDGWSFLGENGKIKYAFAIDKKSKSKIESEIKKTDLTKYKEIRFFTNQYIKQKTKEDIDRENPEVAITIYDIENLVDYVDRYPNLGQYIDLPLVLANITIDYLNDHNQFMENKEKISHYIPRTITYVDLEQKVYLEKKSFLDYCSNLPKFTILQAPAGYGKTCVLEQLHQKILSKETEVILPPVFIRLSTYVPSTLLAMIQEGMREGGDFRCNDFLLLLDGYDEVKECDREFLQKEIEQLLFSNESFSRKVILSVREHTFNDSDFNQFQDKKIISLSELTNEDIKLLFLKESIPAEWEEVFFNNTFFQEFSDNIFYVVNFIKFFKTKKSIAGNVIQLFDFILNQEIERLFRNDAPDKNILESLALYMTLHQNYFIAEQTVAKSFSLNLPMIPFRVSHNSIQEYLAAKKIAKQPIDVIKKIFTKGNLIIPYLTNTLGFVLNILTLNENRQVDFKNLI